MMGSGPPAFSIAEVIWCFGLGSVPEQGKLPRLLRRLLHTASGRVAVLMKGKLRDLGLFAEPKSEAILVVLINESMSPPASEPCIYSSTESSPGLRASLLPHLNLTRCIGRMVSSEGLYHQLGDLLSRDLDEGVPSIGSRGGEAFDASGSLSKCNFRLLLRTNSNKR
jgi:hypothetical protein